MNASFWKNKRVMITGHTGFKGSWLSLWLQELGAKTLGYSLAPPTELNLYQIAHVGEGMESVHGDIRNLDKLCQVVASFQPEIILHLAAQPIVRRSYLNPVETYTTNVIGTVNLLEAVRLSNCVQVVVNVTTDKCYQNKEWHWGYRENEPMGGHDPYSNSKGCAELVTAAYRNSFFLNADGHNPEVCVATARAGNSIGGGDWAEDRLLPDMIKAIMENRPVLIRNPLATRPWQYVLEPLRGYLLLAEKLWSEGQTFADGWNFGPSDQDARNVSWIADRITALWQEGATWKLDGRPHLHESHYLKIDSSKAKNLLGWETRLDVATTLRCVVEWYRSYLDNQDMPQITRNQIHDYAGHAPQTSPRFELLSQADSIARLG